MNLYLVSQSHNTGYDTYDSMVVVAASEYAARHMSPTQDYSWNAERRGWEFVYYNGRRELTTFQSWTLPENVTVTPIGKAADNLMGGVVLTSFNAG